MWKSALIGIQEKPLFGWGLEGVKQLRKKHYEQRIISEYASQFTHAHNQYLHDANVRGLCGLAALLALFFVPLSIFFKNMRQERNNTQNHLWGSLGIIHILSTMGYCLTQAFFSHNSGMMFYIFCTLLFLGLQQNSLTQVSLGNK
ncbi:RfaL protein [Bibersteinia trehalosi USDA-ARS-USMARC-189]|nr:RfaL protein [Bibersteinia trehalosi USDA-ARS-USMARC-189]